MSHTLKGRLSRQTSSSLQQQKIHKKITEQIRDIIRQNNSTLSDKNNKKPQLVPEKIIQKNKLTHKYLYKKTLINTKFQWLNKYLQSSELQSHSVKVKPTRAELQNYEKRYDKNQDNFLPEWKRSKRSKTQGPYFQGDLQNSIPRQAPQKAFFSEDESQNNDHVFKQRSMNKKILSENHLRFKKYKSPAQKSNGSGLDDEHLRRMLMDEKKINRSNCKYLQEVNFNTKKGSDKQNQSNCTYEGRRQKVFRIQINENTPVKQFLECTARINKSNLMIKNKSGYIKNRKKQYIYQSREEKRQQSELLKIKKRCEEEISVEPWNLGGNEKQENEENDFIMNKHR